MVLILMFSQPIMLHFHATSVGMFWLMTPDVLGQTLLHPPTKSNLCSPVASSLTLLMYMPLFTPVAADLSGSAYTS